MNEDQYNFYVTRKRSIWLWNKGGSIVRKITDGGDNMAMPINRKTVGYGENKVLSICKWKEGNITAEVREKDPNNDSWKTTDKITFFEKAQAALKELMGDS